MSLGASTLNKTFKETSKPKVKSTQSPPLVFNLYLETAYCSVDFGTVTPTSLVICENRYVYL